MSAAQLKELIDDRARFVPLTVEQYHRMIETGILPEGEPIELLDGFLVRKDRSKRGEDSMTVGHEPAWALDKLAERLAGLRQHRCYLRIQSPITLPNDNEPEPDAAIVRGTPDDYRGHHPGPDDVLCVIEVADSSLQHDRTTKQRIYADARIPRYLIINLVEGAIEDYQEPKPGTGRYARSIALKKRDSLKIFLPDQRSIELPAANLLP